MLRIVSSAETAHRRPRCGPVHGHRRVLGRLTMSGGMSLLSVCLRLDAWLCCYCRRPFTAAPRPTIEGMVLRYVDLSHPIEHEMTAYPGLPGPTISMYISREESAQRLASGDVVPHWPHRGGGPPRHIHRCALPIPCRRRRRGTAVFGAAGEVIIVVMRASGRTAIVQRC